MRLKIKRLRSEAKAMEELTSCPGDTLFDWLVDTDTREKELAKALEISHWDLTRLLKGQMHINGTLAYNLHVITGLSAQFWLNLDALYKQKLTQIARMKEVLERASK